MVLATAPAQTGMDAASELVGEGIPRYLDILIAIRRFRFEVSDLAERVLREKIADLASALGIEVPLPERIGPYCNPNALDARWSGTWAWVAASVVFDAPLSHSCFFGLTFESSDENSELSVANVTFIHGCGTKRIFDFIKPSIMGYPDHSEDPVNKELGFSRRLQSHETMEAELRAMAENAGGWKKLVP